MPGQQLYLERLKVTRRTLSNELMDIINEFGPKLYDDFDKARGFPVVPNPFLTIILI
jgi:glycerol-3-phosphate O-acyltransferase/dihydroxyacetone phosphate acyltransferase